jgi:hypothetical protein
VVVESVGVASVEVGAGDSGAGVSMTDATGATGSAIGTLSTGGGGAGSGTFTDAASVAVPESSPIPLWGKGSGSETRLGSASPSRAIAGDCGDVAGGSMAMDSGCGADGPTLPSSPRLRRPGAVPSKGVAAPSTALGREPESLPIPLRSGRTGSGATPTTVWPESSPIPLRGGRAASVAAPVPCGRNRCRFHPGGEYCGAQGTARPTKVTSTSHWPHACGVANRRSRLRNTSNRPAATAAETSQPVRRRLPALNSTLISLPGWICSSR